MSMIGNYFKVSREHLKKMLINPGLVPEVIYGEDEGPNTLEIESLGTAFTFCSLAIPGEETHL